MYIEKKQPLFDEAYREKSKLRAFKAKKNDSYFLLDYATQDLEERLTMIKRKFQHAISFFNYTNHVAKTLEKSKKVKTIQRIECHKEFLNNEEGCIAAIESPSLTAESCDLLVSLLTLHEDNHLPKTLRTIYNTLSKDGLFLAAIPGNGTLLELRESLFLAENEITNMVSPRVLPFIDQIQASMLLEQAGFSLPVIDQETITVRYDTLFSLLHDLKYMGATNSLTQKASTPYFKKLLHRAQEIYAQRFCDQDNRIRATFSIIWLSGWKN